MTREEVIKSLGICTVLETDCSECSYANKQGCETQLMKDAAKLLEFDREKEIAQTPPKVVEYKILNREDLLSAFHEYVFKCADEYFNWTGADEQVAHTRLSAICGAAVLMNNILNPRKEESDAD